jgi:hypothetical protein
MNVRFSNVHFVVEHFEVGFVNLVQLRDRRPRQLRKVSLGPCSLRFLKCRVARRFIFKPKIPIWVNFGGPYIGKCIYILWPFGIFYRHLEYFTDIWNILQTFGIFYDLFVHLVFIWYMFSGFGIMYQEKSGNPA